MWCAGALKALGGRNSRELIAPLAMRLVGTTGLGSKLADTVARAE